MSMTLFLTASMVICLFWIILYSQAFTSFLNSLKKSFDVLGKTTRVDFWSFVAIEVLIFITLGLFSFVVIENGGESQMIDTIFFGEHSASAFPIAIAILYLFSSIIPSLSILIRRLRDTNRNWAWIFILCIPIVQIVGLFLILAWTLEPSANKLSEENLFNEEIEINKIKELLDRGVITQAEYRTKRNKILGL